MAETSFHDRLDLRSELSTKDVFPLFARSLTFLWPQRQLVAARIGLMAVIYLLGLIIPWLLKIVVDHGVMQRPLAADAEGLLFPFFIEPIINNMIGFDPIEITSSTLLLLALLFLFVGYSGNTLLEANLAEGADVATRSENRISAGNSAAHGIVGLADLCVAIRLSQRITDQVRSQTFSRLTSQSLTSLYLQRTGDALFRTLHDAPSIAAICHALTLSPLAMVVSVGLNLWVLWMVYGAVAPALVWIGFSAVGLTLVATSPLSQWARRVSQESRASGSATTDEAEEGLKNVGAVQSLGGTDRQRQQFAAASRESFRQSLRLVWVAYVIEWIAENVHLVFATAGFWVIFSGIVAGSLTLGDAPVVIRMYSLLYETAMQFGRIWIDQQDSAAAARRVFFAMDHDVEADRSISLGAPLRAAKDHVTLRFDGVGFQYPDGRRALSDVSFEAHAGETIAIVGPSGAGKTTLAYTIPRFIDPTEGRVLINDIDIASVDAQRVRDEVAFVFQEHQLLTNTVEANLRLAKPDATLDELTEACRMVGALDFINALPDGFDSMIGRGGDTLSMGQKQRLSIARGLLRDTPILILDEPTAALDNENEQILLDALHHSPNRLNIVIAHRLRTIEHADRIFFLEQGSVIETGSPAELANREGSHFQRFARLADQGENA